MNPRLPFALGVAAILTGIGTAIASANGLFVGHPHLAYWFYGGAICLLILAALLAVYGSQKLLPKIVPVGYGKLSRDAMEGLIIENEGAPAYNITPPEPVRMGKDKVIFDDPVITRLTQNDGKRCFGVSVETYQSGNLIGGLFHEMRMENVDHIIVKIKYADSEQPMHLRYTTVCKLERNVSVAGGISAIFVKQKIESHFAISRLFLRRD